MKKLYAVLFSAALSVGVINIGHAAIIRYEVTGTMDYVYADWSNYTVAPLSGHLYISDVDENGGSGYVRFDIPSFVLHSEGFEQVIFHQTGTGAVYGGSDRNISLTSADWSYTSGIVGAGWMQLPSTISWYGQGWIFGPEYYYRLSAFSIQAVGVVPVPAAAWLFGSGVFGLLGLFKRAKAS